MSAASSTSVGQLKVKAAGMKISTDHLPLSVWSLTSMNLPFWKAVVLNGWTVVLMIDMVLPLSDEGDEKVLTGAILCALQHIVG